MSVWILYAQHCRQLYLFKLDRILELEKLMGAEQHRRSNPGGTSKVYPRMVPRGHNLDLAVYVIITAAGPALAAAGGSFGGWAVMSLVLTAGVTASVLFRIAGCSAG
jgi:hypothetical protein